MTISELRKRFTFIAYGDEYERMKSSAKLFDWLIERLEQGHPTSTTCHEWRTCLSWLRVKSSEYKKLMKKMPKPTKEEYNKSVDPWVVGKWPEDRLDDIEAAYEKMQECQKFAERAESVITHTQFMKDICRDKVYESEVEREKKK